MKFSKYSANGNDFVLIEAPPPKQSSKIKELIPRLCHRRRGIGADGVIFLWKAKGDKLPQWRFFNSDASEVALCGNAARVVGERLRARKPQAKEWTWLGKLGLFRARKDQRRVQVQWPLVSHTQNPLSGAIEETLAGFNDRGLAFAVALNIGNPHLVLMNYEVWSPQDRFANNAYLRSHADFGVEGTNVTWLSLKDMSCVTFERGVEEETLACGSGALAAFLTLQSFQEKFHQKTVREAIFHFPGGPLKVKHDKNGYWLSGDVSLSFKGKLP